MRWDMPEGLEGSEDNVEEAPASTSYVERVISVLHVVIHVLILEQYIFLLPNFSRGSGMR